MIVVRIWQGLGNQIFQYAYARCLQQKTECPVYLDGSLSWREYLSKEDLGVNRKCSLQKFGITIPFVAEKELNRWKYIKKENLRDRIIFELNELGLWKNHYIEEDDPYSFSMKDYSKGNYYLMGYYQNLNYYNDIRDILLKEISLDYQLELPAGVQEVMDERETVSVHIRRGDYLNHRYWASMVKYLYISDYYGKAMRLMEDRKEKPVFLFFSDDMEWVKNNIKCQSEHYYISDLGLEDAAELMIMTKCKNNIIANSTFSYWGAWLNKNPDKIVIAPSKIPNAMMPGEWIFI